jgi:hypothetical protein
LGREALHLGLDEGEPLAALPVGGSRGEEGVKGAAWAQIASFTTLGQRLQRCVQMHLAAASYMCFITERPVVAQ